MAKTSTELDQARSSLADDLFTQLCAMTLCEKCQMAILHFLTQKVIDAHKSPRPTHHTHQKENH